MVENCKRFNFFKYFMLKKSKDMRTIFFLLSNTLIVLNLANLNFDSVDIVKYVFWLFIGVLGSITCCLINHNHRHNPIFKFHLLNRMTSVWISLLIGAPSTRLHLVHHFNHHHFYPTLEDWAHYKTCAKGSGIVRILTYLKNAISSMNKHRNELIDTQKKRTMILEERLSIFLFIAVMLLFSWKNFIFFILPVWFIGQMLLLTSNLLNHDFCPLDNSLNNSRDFVSKVENWLFCNNGLHTAHHLRPSMHWSELPSLHELKIAPKKDKTYIEKSFFVYLFKYIIFNYRYV